MHIITKSNNNFLGLKLNNEFEIEENDVIIDNLSSDDLFIGVDNITSENYLNLLNLTNLSFKELYNDLNPNKKFMEQKKNKSRRIKSIYNLLKQIIDLDKYNLKSSILDKINNTLDTNDILIDNDILTKSESESINKENNLIEDNNEQVSEIYSNDEISKVPINTRLDNLVVLSKTGLLLYSAVVLFTGISFGFYLQKFKR